MPEPVFVGIDAGTSGCKGLLLGADGVVVASAWSGYPTDHGPDGGVTQDPNQWWDALCAVLRQLRAAAPDAPVLAMSITAPAHNVVLLDRGGEVLGPVILWSDPRPAATVAALRAQVGDVLSGDAYVDLDAAWTLPQLVWLRHHDPQRWARISHVLPAKDWLRAQLTGEMLTDPSDAAGTALYDARRARWSTTLLAVCGLDRAQLPQIAPSRGRAGRTQHPALAALGLNGVPVAVGATDTAAELVSVGAVQRGDGVIKIATTGTAVVVTDRPAGARGVLVYPHAIDGLWYALTAMNAAGASLRWLSSVLGCDEEQLSVLAASAPLGADGVTFLPHLAGERCPLFDPHATGALVGLRLDHGAPHVARAVLEGVALGLRDCLEHLERCIARPEHPALTGGGMRSALWRQITVDVLGIPGVVRRPCEPALGAALLGAASVGVSVELQREIDVEVVPGPGQHQRYDEVRSRRDARRRGLYPGA